MPTVQVKAQLSMDDMLQAVKQLKTSELEVFFLQIISLLARRKAPGLSKQESELMMKINRGISPEIQEYYNKLIAKRRSETLTDDEYGGIIKVNCTTREIGCRAFGISKSISLYSSDLGYRAHETTQHSNTHLCLRNSV